MLARYSLMWDEDLEDYVHRYDVLCTTGRSHHTDALNRRLVCAITTKRDDALAAKFIRHEMNILRRKEEHIGVLDLPDSRFQNIEI